MGAGGFSPAGVGNALQGFESGYNLIANNDYRHAALQMDQQKENDAHALASSQLDHIKAQNQYNAFKADLVPLINSNSLNADNMTALAKKFGLQSQWVDNGNGTQFVGFKSLGHVDANLQPDAKAPERFAAEVRVPDGKGGFVIKPMTYNRSSDANDPVMAFTAQSLLGPALSHFAQQGADVTDMTNFIDQQTSGKAVKWQYIQNKNTGHYMGVGTDVDGNVVSRVDFGQNQPSYAQSISDQEKIAEARGKGTAKGAAEGPTPYEVWLRSDKQEYPVSTDGERRTRFLDYQNRSLVTQQMTGWTKSFTTINGRMPTPQEAQQHAALLYDSLRQGSTFHPAGGMGAPDLSGMPQSILSKLSQNHLTMVTTPQGQNVWVKLDNNNKPVVVNHGQ